MKIGIIAHLKHPIKSPFAGGLEVFTDQITRLLQRRGHEVILFASSSSSHDLPIEPILSDNGYDQKTGIRKHIKDLPSEYISEHQAYMSLMLKIDGYNFDVIFNNCLHYVPIMMSSVVSTPMVTVLHTPPFYELELAIKAERKYSKIKYCTISVNNAALWNKYSVQPEIVYNGVDLQRWETNFDDQSESYAFWFGRIHPDKGLHLAIAAARSAGIKLLVAGSIADRKYYKNKIEPLLANDVELLGSLSHRDLNAKLSNAAICLITPCWEEPFGLVAAEAMACGTPIAAFDIGALSELIPPTCGYLVKQGDVAELALAIHKAKILERSKIRQHAEDTFSNEVMLRKYEEILAQMVHYE